MVGIYQMADYFENDISGPISDLSEERLRSVGETPVAARLDRGSRLNRRCLIAGIVQHADGMLVPAMSQVQH